MIFSLENDSIIFCRQIFIAKQENINYCGYDQKFQENRRAHSWHSLNSGSVQQFHYLNHNCIMNQIVIKKIVGQIAAIISCMDKQYGPVAQNIIIRYCVCVSN